MAIGTKGHPSVRFDAKSELASATEEKEACSLCGDPLCLDCECECGYLLPWEETDETAEAAVPYLTCWAQLEGIPRRRRHPADARLGEIIARAVLQ